MSRSITISIMTLFLLAAPAAGSEDWPIYKGNIYFTGNNDEIPVKNSNLKWLFQADEIVYNPVVSDGSIYFTDRKKLVYCLDEDTGKPVWKTDLREISSRFYAYSKALGKIKYPLVKGNRLFLTDNIAVYCIDKRNGKVLWARTGMEGERKLDEMSKWKIDGSGKYMHGNTDKWDPTQGTRATVDSIYSNPVIHKGKIFYGTRNQFISREIINGHLLWNNEQIKSYSGFPSFYDEYLFTQSMDYGTGTFTLYCLRADTGAVLWKRNLDQPHKIFSPVVYRRRVYLASGKQMYCFDLDTGQTLWERTCSSFITSNPSFTEREILFTVGNRQVDIINPDTGAVARSIDFGEQSSPYFVTVRDQIYIATIFKKRVGDQNLSYTSLKSMKLTGGQKLWEFVPPFPGGAHQPVSSNGIMFQPAGNYLYAVGTDYYPRIVDGGDAPYDPYNKIEPAERKQGDRDFSKPRETKPEKKPEPVKKEMEFRKMTITTKSKDGSPVPSRVQIRKWSEGKIVYEKTVPVTKPGQEITVPDSDDVEITAEAEGHVPKKVVVSREDDDRTIELDRIEKGKSIVVDNIHFEFGEAYLRKESVNILDRMIESLKKNDKIKIEIRGHTDDVGSDQYNRKLSERRADSVAEYMIKNGISPERIRSRGFGEDKPIANNKTPDGRQKNRRTEFYIIDK